MSGYANYSRFFFFMCVSFNPLVTLWMKYEKVGLCVATCIIRFAITVDITVEKNLNFLYSSSFIFF